MLKKVKIDYLPMIAMLSSIIAISLFSMESAAKIESSGCLVVKTAGQAPPAFQNAIIKFKEFGLFYNKDIPQKFNDAKTLNSYLRSMDPNAEYFEPASYSAFVSSHKDNYVGIGMEIEKNESGKIVCYPYPDSPAYLGGIESGDWLVSVDGQDVSELPIYVIASKIMGVKNTLVGITIVKRNGEVSRRLELKRKYIPTSSVTVERRSDFSIIRINSFSSGTKRDLKLALSKVKNALPIIIDLRDNPGGNLYKAIDSAMLCLGNGIRIVTIRSRRGTKTYESTTPAFNSKSLIYLWQNEFTASAAEVFIAALTENKRAESIGEKSYGKGLTQDVFELNDGSAIVFTTGYLLTPKGNMYHRKGLTPTYELKGDRLSTNQYVQKTKELLESTRP
jgi:carboxyl-terminal processing protease